MRREISDKYFLGNTFSPYEVAGRSSVIHRTEKNYNDSKSY